MRGEKMAGGGEGLWAWAAVTKLEKYMQGRRRNGLIYKAKTYLQASQRSLSLLQTTMKTLALGELHLDLLQSLNTRVLLVVQW